MKPPANRDTIIDVTLRQAQGDTFFVMLVLSLLRDGGDIIDSGKPKLVGYKFR